MSGHRARLVALALTLAPVAALPVVAPGLTAGSHAFASPGAPSASRPPGPGTPTVAAVRQVMAAQTSTSEQTAQATAAATSWRTRLTASFNRMRPALHARSVGVAVVVVGRSDSLTLGTWRSGPAWSTIKVPLSIATLQHADSASTRALVKKAVIRSDNAAAEALWARLGSARRAASRVNAVL